MSNMEQHIQHLEFDSTPNIDWHSKHRLPENPSLDQRVKWHMEHARRCPCPSHDEDIIEELKKRYSGKHQDFWIEHNINDHKALGIWAADCAEQLLPYFEEKYSKDTRPRDAVRILREWVDTGIFSMPVIRGASLGAHAAAKMVAKEDKAANYAAHAAGQAVATAHVPTHAIGIVVYSIKLIVAIHPTDVKAEVSKEREWQTQRLHKNLQLWVDAWIDRKLLQLPKDIQKQLG